MGSGSKTQSPDWKTMESRGQVRKRKNLDLHHSLLVFLDTTFSATVVGPAVVGYWRGTWCLSDLYIFPGKDRAVLSSLTSMIVGLLGLFVFSLGQEILKRGLHPDQHRLTYYVGSRLYTAVFGFCCVSAWRGTWQTLDHFLEPTAVTVLGVTCAGLVFLASIRALRNISAPPFAIVLDSPGGYFAVPTMFRVDSSRNWQLYILDCAFSVGIVGSLVVFVWRGVWGIFDIYLYPDHRERSALGSLVIGYGLVVISFGLQPFARFFCARTQGLARLAIADAFLLLGFLGTVNVWRGIWISLDLWLYPENQKLSCWITHVGCFVLLVLLNCSNSILVRGVYIDAEEDFGKCVSFSCQYLQLFFEVERERKETRRLNLIMTSKKLSNGDGNEKSPESGALLNSSPLLSIIASNPENLA